MQIGNRLKRFGAYLVSFAMVLSLFAGIQLPAKAETSANLALHKPVEVSKLEVDDGRMTGEMAVDGDMNTRISFGYENEQYFKVDLQDVYPVNQIVIRFHELPNAYRVLVAETDEEDAYTEVFRAEGCKGGTAETRTINFTTTNARYVKYEQLENWYRPEHDHYYGGNFWEFEVYAHDTPQYGEQDNLALHKDVTVSGLEVDDGRLTGEMAVDGIVSVNSRVSFDSTKDEQFFEVDLGEVYQIGRVVINFHGRTPYRVLVSADGDTYTQVDEKTEVEDGSTGIDEITFDPVMARYVRYEQIRRYWHTAQECYYSSTFYEFEVYPAFKVTDPKQNIALHKPVEVSKLEVNDGRMTGEMAVDGNMGTRVSLGYDKEEYFAVDLGMLYDLNKTTIHFNQKPRHYLLQVSTDGKNYETVYDSGALAGGTSGADTIEMRSVRARYVKYQQLDTWTQPGDQDYSGNFWEFEVYADAWKSANPIGELAGVAPALSEDGAKLVLPAVSSEEFTVGIGGSDHREIIDLDGNVYQPLVDTTVNLLYRVTSKEDPENTELSTENVQILVPGKYQPEEGDNPKPNVVPGLQEWKGGQGAYTLTADARIVYAQDSLAVTAETLQGFFADMVGVKPAVVQGEPREGDIYLALDNALAMLRTEGYLMNVGARVDISAADPKGVLYGGISALQILYQDEGRDNIPQGLARDYPMYDVRSGMLDVGRMFLPLDSVREITRYMAWFKLNEIHLHINDDGSDAGFRVESKLYPQINEGQPYYTQEEYKAYQKEMKLYGVDVVTEIDTPAHSSVFARVKPEYLSYPSHIDIYNPDAVQFIQSVYNEFLDGDDPVFQSPYFHIGTDEYDKAHSEQMRVYTDTMIQYINSKGLTPRLWASTGATGFAGQTPISNEAQAHIWNPSWANAAEMAAEGYDLINTTYGYLYIVPGGFTGQPDRRDISTLYDKFEVNDYTLWGNGVVLPMGHPQTIGAEFTIWNDAICGMSDTDIFDRFYDYIAACSEKTWFGPKEEGQTADEFLERLAEVSRRAPNANPGHQVESVGETVAKFDFEKDTFTADQSGNGYDLTMNGVERKTQGGKSYAAFDGESSMRLPFGTLGFPYTIGMDLYLDSATPADATLFDGETGSFYFNVDGTGKAGFKRYHYTYVFDYEIPRDKWVSLVLVCNDTNTYLIVDGVNVGAAKFLDSEYNFGANYNQRSSTFVTPVDSIGAGLIGGIDNLAVANAYMSKEIIDEVVSSSGNLALHKPVEVSSLEVSDGRFTAEMAVDGDMSTRVSFGYDDYQYFKIDLGRTYALNQVKIYFGELPNKYEVYVAEVDEEDAYVKVYSDLACPGGTSRNDTIDFAPVNARYVKYVQLENYLHAGLGDHYSGNFFEIEVYGADIGQMQEMIGQAQALYDATPANQVDKAARDTLAEQIAAAKAMLDSMDFTKETFDRQLQALAFAVKRFEEAINPIPGPEIWGAPENGVTRGSGVRLMADKTVTWTVNGVALDRKGANLLLSTEGTYEVFATGDDGGVSETLRFAIDRTGPVLGSEQVETNGSTNQDVVVRADEDARFELDGVTIEDFSRELTVTEPGRHVVRAYDKAGNRSAAFVFTIEKSVPILSTNFYILNGVTRYNVAVTADRRVDYYVNGALVAENEYRCKFLDPGVYEVKAVDAAGNESKTLKFEIRR